MVDVITEPEFDRWYVGLDRSDLDSAHLRQVRRRGVRAMAKWGDLKKEVLSPERIKAAHEEAEHLVRDLRLRELRKALGKTQEQLATLMAKKQASLSKMENQKDWMISTLAEYLHALGANLKVFAEVDGTLYPLLVVDEPSPAVKGRRSRADRSSRSEQKEKAGVHGDGSRQADGTT